jgi:cytochrome c oxidase assembly protein subunit 15
MDLSQRRQAFLHRVALWCAALVLVITSLSAFIRLSQAGLGCEPWPDCYGQALRTSQSLDTQSAGDGAPVKVARLTHRVIASVVLLGVILMVVASFASRPLLVREGALALAVLVLALGLAVLGRWTAGRAGPGGRNGEPARWCADVRTVLQACRATDSGRQRAIRRHCVVGRRQAQHCCFANSRWAR